MSPRPIKFAVVAAALVLAASTSARAQQDMNERWQFDSMGTGSNGLYLTNLGRNFRWPDGTVLRTKVFNRFEVVGVKIGGSVVKLTRVLSSPVYQTNVSDPFRGVTYDRVYAQYTVGSANHKMEILVKLYRDGRIELVCSSRTAADVYGGHIQEIFVRADHDLGTHTRNLVEHTPISSANYQSAVYTASAKEAELPYLAPSAYANEGVEDNVYARFFTGSGEVVHQQSLFLKPLGGFDNPITLYLAKYGTSYTLPPAINTGTDLQKVASGYGATYAHTGQNQMAWVMIRRVSSTSTAYGVQWQFVRKPNGRPLRVQFAIMQGLYDPFTNNDFANVKSKNTSVADCQDNSYNDQMRQLVGPDNPADGLNLVQERTIVPLQGALTPPLYWCTPGSTPPRMDDAALHKFMTDTRQRTTSHREDHRSWHVHVGVVNAEWASQPDAQGLMFDTTDVQREGVAIFSPNIQCGNPNVGEATKTEYMHGYAHEILHAFGGYHSWRRDYPTGAPIACRTTEGYPPASIPAAERFGLYIEPTTSVRWYRQAPESLAKPGKYSGNYFLLPGQNGADPPGTNIGTFTLPDGQPGPK